MCSAFIYTDPIGVILVVTNKTIGLNVVTEMIIGYALPGRPIAMMMFKTWGYNAMYHALDFTIDFKLGHYMKIPPRPMFWCQIVASVIAGTVQLGVQAWMFSNIKDICSPDQPDGFTCRYSNLFGTASIIVSHRSFRYFVSLAQCRCDSGVSLDPSVFSRTVNSTTVLYSPSSWVPLHQLSNG